MIEVSYVVIQFTSQLKVVVELGVPGITVTVSPVREIQVVNDTDTKTDITDIGFKIITLTKVRIEGNRTGDYTYFMGETKLCRHSVLYSNEK